MEKNICGIKFDLPKNGAKLLENYLDEVKKYIKAKKLNKDLYDDIENRIAEKLSMEKEITDITIVNLLNEMGDASEIFGSEDIQISNDKNPRFASVFLGVFAYVAERYNINPWILRIVYLFVFFAPLTLMHSAGGLWILLNIVCYAAVANSINEEMSIKGGVRGILISVISFLKKCFVLCFRIFRFLFKYFFIVIFIAFSLIFGIGALILGPLFFIDVTIYNQMLFANVSGFLSYGVIAGGLVLCILGTFALISLFRKKILNSLLIFVCIGILFLSLGSVFLGIYKTVGKYSVVFKKEKIINIVELTGESKKFDLQLNLKKENFRDIGPMMAQRDFFSFPTIYIQKSDNQNISVVEENYINSDNKSTADSILEKVVGINAFLSGDEIIINDSESFFNEIVPFSFLRRNIIIKIPENAVLDTTKTLKNKFNLYRNLYSTGYFTRCDNSLISFDKDRGEFVCSNSQSEIDGCKSFIDYQKKYCNDYMNSYDITNCQSVISELTGDSKNFDYRQKQDFKYCTDVLNRKQIKKCDAIFGTGMLDENMINYEKINYCKQLLN